MLLLLNCVELTSPLIELLVWALWGMGLLFQITETLMSWFWVRAQTSHQWYSPAFTLKTVFDFMFQFKNVRFPNLNWPSGQRQALNFFLGIYVPLCHRRDIKPFHNRDGRLHTGVKIAADMGTGEPGPEIHPPSAWTLHPSPHSGRSVRTVTVSSTLTKFPHPLHVDELHQWKWFLEEVFDFHIPLGHWWGPRGLIYWETGCMLSEVCGYIKILTQVN